MGNYKGGFDGLDHIGIVVEDLDSSIETYTSLFGFTLKSREIIEDQGMQIATVKLGTLKVELMESTSEQGVLARFLKKRGPGVHHVAYAVTDIKKSLQELSKAGLRLIDTEPRIGNENALIAFAHPKDTGGVLVELCQKQEE